MIEIQFYCIHSGKELIQRISVLPFRDEIPIQCLRNIYCQLKRQLTHLPILGMGAISISPLVMLVMGYVNLSDSFQRI